MRIERVLSLVDIGRDTLLLDGARRGRRALDAQHPFGFGKTTQVRLLIAPLRLRSRLFPISARPANNARHHRQPRACAYLPCVALPNVPVAPLAREPLCYSVPINACLIPGFIFDVAQGLVHPVPVVVRPHQGIRAGDFHQPVRAALEGTVCVLSGRCCQKKIGCDSPDSRAFDGQIRLERLSNLSLSFVSGAPQRVRRDRQHIARKATPSFLLSLQLSNRSRITQAGRTAALGQGDCALYSSIEAYEIVCPERVDQLIVQIPRTTRVARVPHADLLTGQRISGTTALGHVLSSHMRLCAKTCVSRGRHPRGTPGPDRRRSHRSPHGRAIDHGHCLCMGSGQFPALVDAVQEPSRYATACIPCAQHLLIRGR